MQQHEIILNEIKKAVTSVDASAEIRLFGSRARGDNGEDSDWDVLILTNKEVNRPFRLNLLGKLLQIELKYKIGISPVFKNKHEWLELEGTDFYFNVVEDAVLL